MDKAGGKTRVVMGKDGSLTLFQGSEGVRTINALDAFYFTVETETADEASLRRAIDEHAAMTLGGPMALRAFQMLRDSMERRMDRFTKDVVAALAESRTSFENGMLTIREPGGKVVRVNLNARPLNISDAGVAHNEPVLALLRDLAPTPEAQALANLAAEPFADKRLEDYRMDVPDLIMTFVDADYTVLPTIELAKARMEGRVGDRKPDAYELRCGKRLFDAILSNPEVVRAPYDKARVCPFSGNLTLLAKRGPDVEVIEDVGPLAMPDDQGVFTAMSVGRKDARMNVRGVFAAAAPAKPETGEADPAVDRAIHTRDWSGVRGKDCR